MLLAIPDWSILPYSWGILYCLDGSETFCVVTDDLTEFLCQQWTQPLKRRFSGIVPPQKANKELWGILHLSSAKVNMFVTVLMQTTKLSQFLFRFCPCARLIFDLMIISPTAIKGCTLAPFTGFQRLRILMRNYHWYDIDQIALQIFNLASASPDNYIAFNARPFLKLHHLKEN